MGGQAAVSASSFHGLDMPYRSSSPMPALKYVIRLLLLATFPPVLRDLENTHMYMPKLFGELLKKIRVKRGIPGVRLVSFSKTSMSSWMCLGSDFQNQACYAKSVLGVFSQN